MISFNFKIYWNDHQQSVLKYLQHVSSYTQIQISANLSTISTLVCSFQALLHYIKIKEIIHESF